MLELHGSSFELLSRYGLSRFSARNGISRKVTLHVGVKGHMFGLQAPIKKGGFCMTTYWLLDVRKTSNFLSKPSMFLALGPSNRPCRLRDALQTQGLDCDICFISIRPVRFTEKLLFFRVLGYRLPLRSLSSIPPKLSKGHLDL